MKGVSDESGQTRDPFRGCSRAQKNRYIFLKLNTMKQKYKNIQNKKYKNYRLRHIRGGFQINADRHGIHSAAVPEHKKKNKFFLN